MEQNASAKFARQVSMPDEFPEILKDFTREILRHQPDNIYEFGVKYFQGKCKAKDQGGGAEEMSLDQIEEIIQALFQRYDDDDSGYLDRVEFRNLLNDLRTRLPFISEDDLYFFLSEADANSDNKIEYHEFIPIALQIIQTMYSKKRFEEHKDDVAQQAKNILVHGMDKAELEQVLQTIFSSFDSDGSGSLSREEFIQALQSMELGLTRKEINSVLFQYDNNDDGNISYAEFVPFAFDLLSKLTEMRIFETEMAEDELAQFLVDLFKAKEVELTTLEGITADRPPGMIRADDVKDLLHQAKLGLTRLQIYSVLSVADVNEDGLLNYMQFIPKAVTVVRSMLTFESDLAGQVEARELFGAAQEALLSMPNPSHISSVQQTLDALGLEPAAVKAIMLAAQQYGKDCDVTKLARDIPGIMKNLAKVKA